jgi:hypothetical protein
VFSFRHSAINEISEVVALGLLQIAVAYTDQTIACRAHFMGELVAARGENACCELRSTTQ